MLYKEARAGEQVSLMHKRSLIIDQILEWRKVEVLKGWVDLIIDQILK